MKAAVIDGYGGPDRLQIREVKRPELEPGTIRVRVRAAGVNPVDWKIRSGMLRGILRPTFPLILGGDLAGEVEALGEGVTRFRVGDPVFGMADLRKAQAGSYAEFAVIAESAAARKPDAWSFEDAASVPIAGLTALQSLRDLGRVPSGGSVLINGASGGVGTFAVQVGKALGARVVGTCSAPNAELVRSLGADTVIDYTVHDVTRRDERFDVFLDAVARSNYGRARHILKPDGTYVSTLPSPTLIGWMGLLPVLRPFGVRRRAAIILVKPRGEDLATLARFAEQGELRPVVEHVYPLDDVRLAHEQSQTGRTRGKIVLRID
ncbi:NAD(P)-dependent alcohol dehydrogenase [Tautonia sp. JC769]|uniref:NAD(P)-dependent alcohol dehydrogenase n=1 Tax=Tautonia sp. JC769 TaxID=3232135 RepID=UPI003457B6CE